MEAKVLALALLAFGAGACGAAEKSSGAGPTRPGVGGAGSTAGGAGSSALGGGGVGGVGSGSGGTSGTGAVAGGPGLGTPFIPTRIASNEDQNCVITSDQQLYCWGVGALPPAPAPNETGQGFEQISMQRSQRCSIALGRIHCSSGPLQDGRPEQSFAEVRVGLHAACARDTQGTMTCWTDGNAEAAPILENLPTEPAQSFYVALDTACALLVSGTTRCWGFDTAEGSRTKPPRSDLLAVGGWVRMYGIAPDKTAVAWGLDGVTPEVPPGTDYVQIAAGDDHVAMLRADGTVDSIGSDAATEPDDVRFVELSAGAGQTCGITSTGSVRCWGNQTGGRFESPPDAVRAF